MYVPKSKISYKQTLGGEFLIKTSGESYYGPYISVKDTKFFIGTNYSKRGPELIKINENYNVKNDKYFNYLTNTFQYNSLNPQIQNQLKNVKEIPVVKNIPTSEDYRKGHYIRYFSKRFNGQNYLEIDQDTHISIFNKDGKYDSNLYVVGRIKWFLTGNVYKKNALSIKEVERNFPNIFYLFPVLNEFYKSTPTVQENLQTSGGELYYANGDEYIGGYHIHPTKGPMEGAVHLPVPHQKLYYINQLPNMPNNSYEDFISNYNKITCYKCINVSGNFSVVGSQRSVLLGCPADSFQSYDDAQEACITNSIEKPDLSEIVSYNVDKPITPTTPSNILNQGYPQGNKVPSYSNFSPASFSQQQFPDNESTTVFPQRSLQNTCFSPNTMIKMAEGPDKIIAAVKIGDKVKSEKGISTVLNVMVHEGNFELYSINNSKPFVTEEHPFKTIDGWKSINPITTIEDQQISSGTLDLEDILIRLKGKQIVKKITKGKIKYPKVYNLSLDNEHVFYANGYLVHNDKTAVTSTMNTSSPSSGGTSGGGGGGY